MKTSYNQLEDQLHPHAKFELDKRFLYTKTKCPYCLEVLYKMLKDQCEEVNVICEEKFSGKDYVRVTRATLKPNQQSVPVKGFCISCVLSCKVEVKA